MQDTQSIVIDGIDLTGDLSQISTEQLFEMREHAYQLSAMHCSMQVTFKTCRNSMYGATSNAHYAFCNIEVAEDITAEGRFYIHCGEKLINDYLQKQWHIDTELHNYLLTHEALKDNFDPNFDGWVESSTGERCLKQLDERDRVLYIDTDSIYVNFEDCIQSIGYIGKNWAEFIVLMSEFRLSKMFDEGLSKIVESRHGKSVLLFDLETIADTAIFMAKKKYVQCIQWQDGRMFDDPLQHIKGKGIELIQTGSSQLVRDMLKYGYQAILGGKLTDTMSYRRLIQKLWRRFEKEENLENLCCYVNTSKYHEYILNDTTTLEFAPRTLPQYRGSALHNFLIRKYKLEEKYELIENGRLYWYFIDTNQSMLNINCKYDAFAFKPGEYPTEFANDNLIPMNKYTQFFKLVVSPLERIASLTGICTVNPLDTQLLPNLL